jgi:hypothetical protein
MNSEYDDRMVRVDEKIKGLYKIIAAGSKQVDQDSWILDQEISWASLNEYLGLNVVPGELIPYETCMGIVGEFTGLGVDWDDIPKEGLGLMELIASINIHIVPTTRNLTMKNEYAFSSFGKLRNNTEKHYFAGSEIKGVQLKAGSVSRDHFSAHKSSLKIAEESLANIRDAKTFGQQCALLVELTDLNFSKFRNLSKRRKKKLLALYIGDCPRYNTVTGKLSTSKKRHHPFVAFFPIYHTCFEPVPKAQEALFNAWLKHF